MAEQRIKYDDLFAEDIFKIARESAEELIKTIGLLNNEITKLGNEAYANFKKLNKTQIAEIKKQAEEIKKLGELKKKITKTELETKATLNKLNNLEKKILDDISKAKEKQIVMDGKEYKELLKLKEAINQKNKEIRQSIRDAEQFNKLQKIGIKLADSQKGAYTRLAQRLSLLRKAYKDLRASGTASQEELDKLKEKIQSLDAELKEIDADVGQFQRNVGDYSGQLKEHFDTLGTSIQDLGGQFGNIFGIIISQIKNLGVAFKSANGGLNKLRMGLKVLKASGIILIISLIAEALQTLGDTREGMYLLMNVTERLSASINNLTQALINFYYATRNFFSAEFSKAGEYGLKGLDNLKETFTNLVLPNEKLNTLIDRRIELIQKEVDAMKDVAKLTYEKTRLELEYETLIEQDRINPLKRLGKQLNLLNILSSKVKEIGEKEVAIAREKYELAKLEAELYPDRISKQKELAEAYKNYMDTVSSMESELISIQTERKSITKELIDLTIEYFDKLQEVSMEVADLEAELLNNDFQRLQRQRENELRQIENARKEALSQFAGFEKIAKVIFGVNGQIIQAGISSVRAQFDELIKLTNDKYDKLTTDLREKKSKEIAEAFLLIDNDRLKVELTKIKKEYQAFVDELAKDMRDLGFSEQEIQQKKARALSNYIIKMADLERRHREDSLKKEIEYRRKYAELTIDDKEKLSARLQEIEKESLEETIKIVKKQMEAYEGLGMTFTEGYKQLNKELTLLQLQLDKLNKTGITTWKDRFEQELKNIANSMVEIYELIKTYMDKVAEATMQNIDTQISAIDKRINMLSNMADANFNNIEQSISSLEKQKEELEQERKKVEAQKQRRELLMSALSTYQGYLKQGQTGGQALVSTIKDIALLKTFISNLPVYHKGTEYVEGNGREVLAKLEVGERVIPKDLNKQLSGISNETLVKKVTENRTEIVFDYDNLREAINTAIFVKNNKRLF